MVASEGLRIGSKACPCKSAAGCRSHFFATPPKPQTYGLRPDYPDPTLLEHLLQTEQDLNTVEFEDEMEFLLSDFSTGKYFSDLCKDAALYPAIDGQ